MAAPFTSVFVPVRSFACQVHSFRRSCHTEHPTCYRYLPESDICQAGSACHFANLNIQDTERHALLTGAASFVRPGS